MQNKNISPIPENSYKYFGGLVDKRDNHPDFESMTNRPEFAVEKTIEVLRYIDTPLNNFPVYLDHILNKSARRGTYVYEDDVRESCSKNLVELLNLHYSSDDWQRIRSLVPQLYSDEIIDQRLTDLKNAALPEELEGLLSDELLSHNRLALSTSVILTLREKQILFHVFATFLKLNALKDDSGNYKYNWRDLIA